MCTVRITAGMAVSRHHFTSEDTARLAAKGLRYAQDIDRIEIYEGDAPNHPNPLAIWDARMATGMAWECTPVIISE